MKLLYIALCDLCANGEAGIRKKVWGQLKSLSKRFDTYLVSWENFIITTYHGEEKTDKKVLLSYADIYGYIGKMVADAGIDIVFIRYLQTNPWLNQFLKEMKKRQVKVILEFPTIPYEEELKGRVELEEDTIYRGELKKYVRYSTNYNGLSNVFGIPSVSLHNGVNIEDIPVKNDSRSEGIGLIAVAGMNFWHGYDRLIQGMADYYSNDGTGKEKVFLKLVGSGKEIPHYRDLILENRLSDYVCLEGMKSGAELDALYDKSDIAVGSLGMYREHMTTNSAIKTKEYCARGIPIILGSEDLAFPGALPFVHRVPNDASPIDIEGIVAFYKKFKGEGNRMDIRAYAEEYLTWDVQFDKMYQFMGL